MTSDLDWDGVDIDPNEVTHSSAMSAQILVDLALGDDNLAQQQLSAFQAELTRRRPRA